MQIRPASILAILFACSAFVSQAATTGVVMDREGRPLAGARVAAYALESSAARLARITSADPSRKALAEVVTGKDGAFSIDALKERVAIVQFSADGFAPASRFIARDEDLGAIPLRPAAGRKGRITAAGKPVAGATIIATAGYSEIVTRTDAEGAFSLPDPKIWMSRLTVLHPSHAIFEEPAPADRQWKSLDRALSQGTAISGRVVASDGRTSVAGAALLVDGWPAGASREDGTFAIERAPATWRVLEVRSDSGDGYIASGTKGAITIRLAPPSTVSGVVRDSGTKQPVANAIVQLWPGADTFGPRSTAISTVTDEKGAYAVRLRPGSYSVSADHPAYYSKGINEVSVVAGRAADRPVAVWRAASVSGFALFDDKTPVAGGSMTLRNVTSDRMRMAAGGGTLVDGYSGPDGRFSIKVTPEEQFELAARKRGYPEGVSARFRMEAGEKKSGLQIVVPRGVEVSGKVTDANGRPLAGVSVVPAEAENSGGPGMMVMRRRMFDGTNDDPPVETNGEGAFSLRLKEATYDLAFRREGFAPSFVRALKVSASPAPVAVTMRQGVEVSGRVTRGGVGLEGVNVAAVSPATGDASSITDAGGYFTVRDLAPGQYMLIASKFEDGIRDNRNVTAPARDVAIEVPVGGRITGRVVDRTTGAPVTAFRAGVGPTRGGGGMMIMMPTAQKEFTNADGSFVLENVAPGTVEVIVQAPGYVRGRAPGIVVEDGKTADAVEVKLDTGSRITGKVTSPTGAAVADARVVVVVNQRGPWVPGLDSNGTTTDASGQYVIEAVDSGTFEVAASHPSYVQSRKTVEVSGKEVRVDFRLESGTRVSGQVVTESGVPVPDASVSASSAGTSAFNSTKTDANGNFTFDALPAARYTFNATKAGLANGIERDVDIVSRGAVRIVMGAGALIYGRVFGLSETELASAEVGAVGQNGRASAGVDAAGNYRIEGAPTGSVQVAASVGGFTSRKSTATKTVQVEAGGSAQADLEFRSDVVVSGRVSRNGAGLRNVRVMFSPASGARGSGAMASTDDSGYYSVSGLEDGTYDVNAFDPSTFGSIAKKYEVRGSGRFDIDVPSTALRGRVTDADTGAPIVGASVETRPVDSSRMTMITGGSTDSTGSFTINSLVEGAYRVTATMAGYGAKSAEATVTPSGGEVEIKLTKTDGVRIRLVDARDGRALNGRISFYDMNDGWVVDESVRAQEGDAQKVAVSPGQYIARVYANGYASATVVVSSPGQVTIPVTPGGTIEVTSRAPETVTVRLVDASGRVYMVYGRARSYGVDPSPAVTTLRPVAGGSYTLQVVDEAGRVLSTRPVTVQETQTVRVEVQ